MKSAIPTGLRGGSPLANLKKLTLMFFTLISQYLNKLVEGKIGDFTSPQAFHAVKVQRFNDKRIKLLTKFACQLPMKIFALVGNFAIQPGKGTDTPPPAVRPFLFSRKRRVEGAQFVQGVFHILWVLYFLTRRKCQIRVFHTEVCPNTLTRCWQRLRFYKIGDEIKPIVAASVALYRETSDISMPLAMLMERIRHFVMSPFPFAPSSEIEGEAIVFQRPPGLFQRQGFELMPFLYLRSTPKFLEKTRVGKMYPFQFFLQGLTRQGIPMGVRRAFQLSQMFTHRSGVGIRHSIFITLPLPLMKIRVNLPHIVKQIAKSYTIRLFNNFVCVGSHGISDIRLLTRAKWVGRHIVKRHCLACLPV